MTEELLVRCCAPTLAGLKTGSLFCCPCTDPARLCRQIRRYNGRLAPRGLRLTLLRLGGERALLYLFRPAHLQQDLVQPRARDILLQAGYREADCAACVRRLCRRLREAEDFPHEIGLFLSYPPEDVQGFIDNKAQNYKFIGYWKVYGDEVKARRTFSQYKSCTDQYCRRLRLGCGLEQLAVSV